ncbi:MAG: CHASE2 domain-containing protein [Cyclobacteriaceae bacterium]|nr:CHASE2 domain-containing protein [Cyclobacteriaceae bacterium]
MRRYWLQGIAVTVFVFGMGWFASIISDYKIFSAFDSIGQALQDTELTDYAFNKLRPEPKVDDRFVLVNIGYLSRGEIAREIAMISQHKPRVIGIDTFFNCEGNLYDTINCPQLLDTLGNLMLSNAIQEAGNIVLGEKLMQTRKLAQQDVNESDSLEISDPMFSEYSDEGFVTLPTNANSQADVKLCRSIWPTFNVAGKRELAFSTAIAMKYDSVKTNKYLARGKEEEIVNYRGNIEVNRSRVVTLKDNDIATTNFKTMFTVIDHSDVLSGNFDPALFKDKVVMMGYLGTELGDPSWEDKFFTPLNKKIGGRANPDMFGLVVHANIVAMILNEDYIDEIEPWQQYLIAFIVCMLTVVLFSVIDEKLPIWYDALSVIIQLVQLVLLGFIVVYTFSGINLKLDLTLTFAATALVGPCYDIYKSIQNEVLHRLTKRREKVLTE